MVLELILIMNRIVIIGNGGSGKSTFAKKLGKKLKIKVMHLDNLYQKSQGKINNSTDWDHIQEKLVTEKKWIIDGNFPRTWHIRINCADTIIFFDFPLWISIYRTILRRIRYSNSNRPDMPIGVKEKLEFKDIKKLLMFPKPESIIKNYKLNKKNLIIFKNNKEADRFLNS